MLDNERNAELIKKTPSKRSSTMTLVDRKLIRLLIVDDEEDFRDASCSYFRKFGYQVESAENGRLALELTEKSAFDVAVIDIHMPEMDGLELLEQLQEGDNETQAIMLTGGGTIENAVESMKRGAFGSDSSFLRRRRTWLSTVRW